MSGLAHTYHSFFELVNAAAVEAQPLTAYLQVTERCDQRCVHCYLPPDRDADELTLAEIDDLLGQLRQAGTLFVSISGGEPTLRPDFLDLLALVRRHHLALRLFTNGNRIDRSLAEAIASFCPVSTDVSLYGSTPEVHEAITGVPGSHQRTVEAIGHLASLGLAVVVKMPLMRQNVADYPRVQELARSLGATFGGSIGYLYPPAGDSARLGEIAASDEEILELLAQLPRCAPPSTCVADAEPEAPSRLCGAGNSFVNIFSDGRVSPCPIFFEAVGSIRRSRFEEIWRDAPFLQELRRTSPRDLPACRRCELASTCPRCAASAYHSSGDLSSPDQIACRLAQLLARSVKGLP